MGSIVGHGRGHDQYIAVAYRPMDLSIKIVTAGDGYGFHSRRRKQAYRAGDQFYIVPSRHRCFRDRVSHFSRGAVAKETNGVDRFTGRPGRDHEPHAIRFSWPASRNSARKAMSVTFHKRPTPSYPQASIPSSGPMNSIPRLFNISTFFWVAACSHIFPFMAGATRIGARVASAMAASGWPARPCASSAITLAVAGAIRTRLARSASSICPGRHFSVSSKKLVVTGFFERV